MYKLLLVDDEKIVIDGLIELIERSKLDELEIYKAFSADDAVEILKKKKIDIVITDISMPGMSGIEFHTVIREYWPMCKVIFFTAYDQFEYAQFAIRNSGVDFILKTEGEDRIINAIKNAISIIDRNMQNDELLKKAREQMRFALPILKNRCLMEIIQGLTRSSDERKQLFKEFNIPLDYNSKVMLIIGRIDSFPDYMDFATKMETIYTIQDLVLQYLSRSAMVDSATFEVSKFIWVIQPNMPVNGSESLDTDALWAKTIPFIHGTLDYIQNTIKKSFNITFSFATDSKPYLWDYTGIIFDHLKFSLNKTAGISKEVLLLDCSNMQSHDPYDPLRLSTELKIRNQLKRTGVLRNYLESGERDKFFNELSSMLDAVKNNNLASVSLKKDVYYSLTMMLLNFLLQSGIVEKVGFNFETLSKINESSNYGEITDYFFVLSERIFEYKRNEYVITTNNLVKKINEYINHNINKDLSLTTLSDLFNFNSQYLSRVYKQHTGKNISEYIWEVKLKKAKELLKKSNMKINDIAFALGFNTPSYFTYFFKKNAAMSPQQYRDKNI